ncbi:MAG TPA: methyltransferase domain-containing protein [Anaeromyxobacter sp.]
MALKNLARKAVRAKTRLRWRIWNGLDAMRPVPDRMTCPLCGAARAASEFPERLARCAFQGGRIRRRECPECGVVFGSPRMLGMSEERLSREYRDLYFTYEEGDTTEAEVAAFRALRPRPSGTYLNFGSGRWSKAADRVRAEGYRLVEYEPYAQPGTANPSLVTEWDALARMKFDGIMSNNLIEHVQDPVALLRRLTTLLTDDAASMVHATACYRYEYEYSRFHLFFFTGRSAEVLAQRAGLRLEHTDHPDVKRFTRA